VLLRHIRGVCVVVAILTGPVVRLVHAAQPAAAIDACEFLRTEEVAKIMNVRVIGSKRADEGNVSSGNYVLAGTYSSTCLWTVRAQGSSAEDSPPSDTGQPLAGASYVILNAMQWPKGSHAAGRFLQSFRDAAKMGDIDETPVALDIAEGALWWGDGVAAFKGDRSFGVSVHLEGGRDQERGLEEALARVIATRL
jgi:hypothetical protein